MHDVRLPFPVVLAGVAACLLAVLAPRLALACACCDGGNAVKAVGWSADGEALLLDTHSFAGCEFTRSSVGLRRGDGQFACFVPPGKTELACGRVPKGARSTKPGDYPNPVRAVRAGHVRSEFRMAHDEDPAIRSVDVQVFAGGAWRPLFRGAVFGMHEPGQNEEVKAEQPVDGTGRVLVEVAVLPAPDGKHALVALWNQDANPGIGYFVTSLAWVELPDSVGAPPGEPSVFEAVPPHDLASKKQLAYPEPIVPGPGRHAIAAVRPVSIHAEAGMGNSWNALGLAKHRKSDFAGSAKAFAGAASYEPENPFPRYNLACAYARLGMPELALWQLSLLARPNCPKCTERLERARVDEDFAALRSRADFRALVCGGAPDCLAEPASEGPGAASGLRDAADGVRISLLTMGPGDHPFFKFGHNALWVHDSRRDAVYNYGTFAFGPGLIPKFLLGRFDYWLSVQSLPSTLGTYREQNRSVVAQELRLTADETRELVKLLEWNARDANKYYRYDYYLDNCSTRLRDLVDKVIGGRLREASGGAASMTFREHTERLTADAWLVYLGLDAAMGDAIDRPLRVWDEMFLPSKLSEGMRSLKVPAEGAEAPFVVSERTLVAAHRGPSLASPPRRMAVLLGAGIALGAVLAGLGAAGARGRKVERAMYASLAALVALVLGFLGTLFTFFWAFTNHAVAYRNENILQCAPWALALPVLAFGLGRGRERSAERFYRVATACALASMAGLALQVFPIFDQVNGQIIALTLPIWAGMAWGARRLVRPR